MAEQQAARLRITKSGKVTHVEFEDRKILDELCIQEIQEELTRLVEEQENQRLLLSFKNVEHLSSAALGMLITLKKKIESRGGKLKLSDINPQIYEIFKITRLNKIFDIQPTAEEAKASFG